MVMMMGKERKDPVLEGLHKKSGCLTPVGLDTAANDSDDSIGDSDDSSVTALVTAMTALVTAV